MGDEPLGKNAAMRLILAKTPPIPPPKGYPGGELTDAERDFQFWLQKVEREARVRK